MNEILSLSLSIAGPTLAAYVAVRVTLKEAILKAEAALKSAGEAHTRIDAILMNHRAG